MGSTAPAPLEPRRCKGCGRVYRSWTQEPCNDGDDCWKCKFPGAEKGWHSEAHDDVDEVVTWSCPHGTMYDQLCRGCGTKVGGWGMGAAGFGELCGCEPQP